MDGVGVRVVVFCVAVCGVKYVFSEIGTVIREYSDQSLGVSVSGLGVRIYGLGFGV